MNEEIITAIHHYTPTDATIEQLRATPMVLTVGITGAGKDTVERELLKTDRFEKIITSTTRAPRANDGIMEEHGREYYFFTLQEATEKVKNHEYFEVAVVHERINGATSEEIERLYRSGRIALGNVDYQGAAYYKKYAPEVTTIFLVPPSYEVWRQRLMSRYASEAELKEAWPSRRESAIRELTHALQVSYYHVVVNDSLDKAVRAVLSIVDQPDIYTRKDDEARLLARDLLDEIAAHETI